MEQSGQQMRGPAGMFGAAWNVLNGMNVSTTPEYFREQPAWPVMAALPGLRSDPGAGFA